MSEAGRERVHTHKLPAIMPPQSETIYDKHTGACVGVLLPGDRLVTRKVAKEVSDAHARTTRQQNGERIFLSGVGRLIA